MATRGRIRDDVVPTNYVQRRGVAPPPDTKSPSSAARLVRSVDFMCGITGFWAPSLSSDAAAALLEAMNRAVLHRGPDGGGAWFEPSGGPSLGHRRLAILDLSPTGLQPMHSASGRYTMTFNGEVYNFQDLKDRLEAQGRAPKWRGSSDTEVMLAAIESWGLEAALQRFIGMFAFGLWDARDRTLTLVRDRVGVKPLYYSQTPAGLCFGSELKSLRLFPGFRTAIELSSLAGFLRSNCVPGQHTIFQGTSRVDPGTFLTFSSAAAPPRVTRYWDPAEIALTGQAHPFQGTEEEAVDQLDHLLRDAVKLRMVADVPLGAFLSGGIDSSTVVALMQAQCSRPVHTFSIENENAAYDEGNTARAVARHLNTHHTTFTVTPRDALDVIPLLPTMFDEPFADSSQIPTYLVSKLARRDVTVALSGDGGDESFGGYVRHVWAPRVWKVQKSLPHALRRAVASWMTGKTHDEWDSLYARARPFVPASRIPGFACTSWPRCSAPLPPR
jgi:asparagine synthase (glutamine-hydrolysing)